jgi:DNA-binding transcriptional LysR family regulator
MQIEALKVFCDVARCRSFSQAAQENGLSQSAASQIVLQLEKRLGVKLISRSPRPLQLTPLGRTYYDGCKHLLEQYGELEASIRNAQTEMEGSVQVAAIYSVGLGDMGDYVERFSQQQPHARVHIAYLHPDQVYERVHEGTADFGLVSFPRKSRELVSLPWRNEEMVLVCHPTHPLARNLAVMPAQLNGEKFVGFARGLVIRREMDRFLREQGVSVEVALEFDSIENIKKAVEVAAGVALLPEPTIRREVADRTLVALPLVGCSFHRPLGILFRRSHQPSKTAQKFIELLRQSATPTLDTPTPHNGAHTGRNGAARSHRKTTNPARE